MDQTERLLDLLGLLLDAAAPVTFEHIRMELKDAYTQGDVDSAKRMFERDKDALRELGIPIETTSKDDTFHYKLSWKTNQRTNELESGLVDLVTT